MKQRTKMAISRAFVELLQSRTIDKITVKDIAEKCDINRQTFYYHFADIYELMEWTINYNLEKYISEKDFNGLNWKEELWSLIEFLRMQRKLLINAYDAKNRIYYEQFVREQIAPIVKIKVYDCEEIEDVPEDKIEFVENVYTRVLTNLFFDWLEDGMPDESKIHLEDYFTLIEGSLSTALQNFQIK
ncbi:TetR/AcrR family transcriptional regulator C-terminal domain-containing protein [Anaerostipes sp. MSJ-23]|uniref:TetR/AcrR family transcriptional regulator C-terminal domain-containing protein n=1 Tax=Anaerostipes sp. MSJ-23 TaxID=2841520 RepID=UPI001C1023E5|nr:TetR/AcrR family transcriptional regulator C-terminal domain-containing protein [Anaerostipes sp. MSJ-23]MBU5459805.1 TetR/AcrR family transcriptional regulator C-terminal domain-containing protein [Anaerostipes sp. MSJ-23]